MSDSASGGSPLENVTTTCEFGTGVPQSSVTRMLNGVGHPAGDENAFTSEELMTASLPGEHPAAERSLSPADAVSPAPAGRTTNVTFAVRMVWLENDTETSPVYTPGFKLAWFTLTEIWPGSGVDAAPPGLSIESHAPPSSELAAAWKAVGWSLPPNTVSVCAEGTAPPDTAMK